MRTSCLIFSSMLVGCESWPAPTTHSSTAAPTPIADAGSNCRWLTTVRPDAPPEVSGAFCFGVAAGASEYLACALVNASDVQCADELVGLAYVARWTGGQANVFGNAAVALGAVTQLRADRFAIETAAQVEGVCTIHDEGIGRAEFCGYPD